MTQTAFFTLDPEQNPLLANLTGSVLDSLLARGEKLSLPAGRFLMHEGDEADAIYFLLSGEVSILKGSREIDRQGGGGALGEMGVLTHQPRTTSVKCLDAVEVLRVGAKEFLQVVDANPEILRAMIRDLVDKMQGTQKVRVQQLDSIQKATDILSRAVSPEVLDRILDQNTPEELLEGRLNEAAILFFDIRGFTSVAEQLPPRELLQSLNEHLAVIIDSVTRHHGTIVNFIGDAVLAIFNCPVPLDEPASVALSCYLDCRERIQTLSRQRRAQGQISFELGAGINYGTVVSGAIGAESRFSYSVLGDEVNLAARLESLTRAYPTDLILSGSCFRRLNPQLAQQCIALDYARVKGREQPVGLFTLSELPETAHATYQQAFQDYLEGDFEAAAKGFRQLGGALPVFLAERCEGFALHHPDWPGYFVWDDK